MHNLIEQLKKRVTGYHEIKLVVLPFLLKYLTVDDAGVIIMLISSCEEWLALNLSSLLHT